MPLRRRRQKSTFPLPRGRRPLGPRAKWRTSGGPAVTLRSFCAPGTLPGFDSATGGLRGRIWYGRIFLEPIQNGDAGAVSFSKYYYFDCSVGRKTGLGAYASRNSPPPPRNPQREIGGAPRNFANSRKSSGPTVPPDSSGAWGGTRDARAQFSFTTD